jgi:hypothetical protein
MAVERLDFGGIGAVGVPGSVSMIGRSSGRDLSKEISGKIAETGIRLRNSVGDISATSLEVRSLVHLCPCAVSKTI